MEDTVQVDDRVLYLQHTFRALLDALSHPGTIYRIAPRPHATLGFAESSLFNTTVSVAETLLDSATTYYLCIDQDKRQETQRFLAALTYSASCDVSNAEYIFVAQSCEAEAARNALLAAQAGTFIDPHDGATLVIECERLLPGSADWLTTLQLSGPGVNGTTTVSVDRIDWLTHRQERQDEYPLGIDLFLVDQAGAVIGIPRTSNVEILTHPNNKAGVN